MVSCWVTKDHEKFNIYEIIVKTVMLYSYKISRSKEVKEHY
jgi:hypothetical protein